MDVIGMLLLTAYILSFVVLLWIIGIIAEWKLGRVDYRNKP